MNDAWDFLRERTRMSPNFLLKRGFLLFRDILDTILHYFGVVVVESADQCVIDCFWNVALFVLIFRFSANKYQMNSLNNCFDLFYRESIALFQELADIFSNENNQIASRELLMKVSIQFNGSLIQSQSCTVYSFKFLQCYFRVFIKK